MLMLVVSVSLFCGCAKIDRTSIRASSDIPESAKVDDIQIAKDESKPNYAILVQYLWDKTYTNNYSADSETKLDIKADSTKYGAGLVKGDITSKRNASFSTYAPATRTRQITAQLNSALSSVGNFVLLSGSALVPAGNGNFRFQNPEQFKNVKGPYLMRARITEYTEVSDYRKEKLNLGLYKNKETESRGVVAIDVELVDGLSGTIVSAFPVKASFGYQNREEGSGGLLPIYKQRQYAQSALDQALRQASNQTAVKLWEKLSQKY